MNNRFFMIGNGPYANRGCEAITKSTVRLVREFFPNAAFISADERADYDQPDEKELDVTHIPCFYQSNTFSRLWLSRQVYSKTGMLADFTRAGKLVGEWAPKSRAVLSVGGDMYGLSHGVDSHLQYIYIGEAAFKCRKPFVIWGATIGSLDSFPKLKKASMEHFRKCTLILVRDQKSLDYLALNGVSDNVRLTADPAFLLEPEEPNIPIPVNEPLEETIGFNLAAAYGGLGGLGSFRDMIELGADCVEAIIKTTQRPVVLVPHIVALPSDACPDNDTVFLSLVREKLQSRGLDVPLLPSSLRSWEIKWALAHLKCYIGSRWHSTVGSFDSCTPTGSLVFSEKGPALNELLLGHTRYVLSCENITPGSVADLADMLIAEDQQIRDTLCERIPQIKQLSRDAGKYLAEWLR